MLYERLALWQFPDKYVLEPIDVTFAPCLSISRFDGSSSSIGRFPECSTTCSPSVCIIFGVIGMLKLSVGSYLLVITKRECVGSYLGHAIYKISDMQILPCNNCLNNSSAEQKKIEAEFSVLLDTARGTPGLYFSYDVHLTLCFQKLYRLEAEQKHQPLWREAQTRFVWNSYMLEPLIGKYTDSYKLPIIQGSFQTFQAAIGSQIINVTLIARRCMRRTGTRMWRRGADSQGNVANFVELEQILQTNGFTTSFVQVCGSMPFLWEQIVDLTYKPNFDIVRPDDAPRVVERHLLDLRRTYGSVVAVDIANKHGSEGRLSETFANAIQSFPKDVFRYIHFDFDKICGQIHFEHLSILYNQIEDFLNKHGYFQMNDKGLDVALQTGIVRTNCIDCLDQTNITQSMIGCKMLEIQLRRIGLFGPDDTIIVHPYLDANLKILWANHGDAISIQYSGTPALKGDVVRYGTRTLQGIANDGWNAIARYYLNNFADGAKQSFRLALTLVLCGLIFAYLFLQQAQNNRLDRFLSLIWAGLSLGIAAFLRVNGQTFTNRPQFYRSGPGLIDQGTE